MNAPREGPSVPATLSPAPAGDSEVSTPPGLIAGTGQTSRQLEHRSGLEVVAVEPDPAMRTVMCRRCPTVRVFDGTAERIPLDDQSVDAVLVGSAWHWFDHQRAVPEIARVLRVGGRLAAVGTSPDSSLPRIAALLDEIMARTLAERFGDAAEVELPMRARCWRSRRAQPWFRPTPGTPEPARS